MIMIISLGFKVVMRFNLMCKYLRFTIYKTKTTFFCVLGRVLLNVELQRNHLVQGDIT